MVGIPLVLFGALCFAFLIYYVGFRALGQQLRSLWKNYRLSKLKTYEIKMGPMSKEDVLAFCKANPGVVQKAIKAGREVAARREIPPWN